MNEFTERVIKVIKSVPSGRVLTYGRVALLAGSPYAARQVGWILNGMTDTYDLPWQRIINAKGEISLKDPIGYLEQRGLLESEGIEFKGDKIDLKIYMWDVDFVDFDQIDLETR